MLSEVGRFPNLHSCYSWCVDLELRPLPSIGITRLQRYYEPLRHPVTPGLSLTGVRLIARTITPLCFPCCGLSSSSIHAVTTTPAEPQVAFVRPQPVTAAFPVLWAGRLPHRSFRGLHGVHITLRPACSPSSLKNLLHRRLQTLRYLHACSSCYRLERKLPGGIRTH